MADDTPSGFLVGEHVSLRALEREDIPFVREGANDPRVRSPLGLWYPSNAVLEERWFDEANERDDVLQFVIERDGQRVGVVELDPIDWQAGVADVGIWLHPDDRGSGHAREALHLVVGYAFAELRLHKVTANAYAPNERSRAMLEAVGFTEEGVGREDAFLEGRHVDTHYYGVLVDEWDGGASTGGAPGTGDTEPTDDARATDDT